MEERDAERRFSTRGMSKPQSFEVNEVVRTCVKQRTRAGRQRDAARAMREEARAMRARVRPDWARSP